MDVEREDCPRLRSRVERNSGAALRSGSVINERMTAWKHGIGTWISCEEHRHDCGPIL
jgi:hypothetical protein